LIRFLNFIFLFFVTGISAQIQMGPLFSDDMILQRESQVPIWGLASPNEKVTILSSWNNRTASTKADNQGNWIVKIETPLAGGPYEINISSGDSVLNYSNVLIGEVWIASGQSNMQMALYGGGKEPVFGSIDMIAQANNSNIRLFTVRHRSSETPKKDLNGKWLVSSPSNVSGFSAVAYSFANYLNKVLDIPIGIIHSSWGGSPAEAWTDQKTLNNIFEKSEIRNRHKDKAIHHNPSGLFNAMINPLIPFKIRGAIWYQGESNVGRANNYTKLMNNMIDGWRSQWNQGSFPFYFVQIAPNGAGGNTNKTSQAFLREAQLMTMLQTENTGMVVTLDIGSEYTVHPPEKILVGKRLAYWALVKDYKLGGISFSGPVYKSLDIKGHKVIVNFDYAQNGITSYNKPIVGFEIAGSNKVFYKANAKVIRGYGLNRSKLEVSSDSVKNPEAVRYGWKNYLIGNLYNSQGLPASSFRSDNW
jgi:sialate O-acetylesterase|tara:strand:- start:225 stop:1646 length:1422 start_codon:yes stop_codon:yes gene_type:complete